MYTLCFMLNGFVISHETRGVAALACLLDIRCHAL
jgi:hypothetical protein